MSFQYPLGLLGLIGVPVLIIIYIIKSKFTEQTVSSTYLWNLSDRFLTKKRKDNKITGLISLILQILAVVIISFTIAHPAFTLRGAANDYYFILDSTGSMNTVSEAGKTRYTLGKEQIKAIIEESADGSLYTLVSVNNEVSVLYEKEDNREVALSLLEKAECGQGSCDLDAALSRARQYTQENDGVRVLVATDKQYAGAENVEVLGVFDGNNNYALSGVTYEYSAVGELKVEGFVTSYTSDASLDISLYIDEETKEEYKQSIKVKKGEPAKFSYTVAVEDFKTACVKLMNKDALMLDNESIMYNVKSENAYKTLLVSDTPFFLETVLKVVGNADVTVMSPENYLALEEKHDTKINGYSLYIFHSCNPKAVPKDGGVWLINTSASIENSGFGYQTEVVLKAADTIDKTKNTATVIRDQLLKDVSGEDIYISKYSRYDTSGRKFYTLFTYDATPVIFTGTNVHGNRQVVFAFDLHNSDLPLSSDFIVLTKNLLDFSFPTVMEKTYYSCGDTAKINVVSGCESIRVESPSGKISHVGTSEAVGDIFLDEVGTYNIKVVTSEGLKNYRVYSSLAEEEQNPSVTVNEKISLGIAADKDGIDGIYDKLIVFFICLAVIFVADWVVYCYDKYQLR